MADTPDLDSLRAVMAQRTPGEWIVGGPYPGVSVCVCVDWGSNHPEAPEPPRYEPVAVLDQKQKGEPNPQAVADARAIIAAVNAIGPLLERVEELERLVLSPEQLDDVLDRWDETEPWLQRQIAAAFAAQLAAANERIAGLEARCETLEAGREGG